MYLRAIQAKKLISITRTLRSGDRGIYSVSATISYNNFTYLDGISNSFYISTTVNPVTTLSVQSSNYPLNRKYTATYTFTISKPVTTTAPEIL